MRLERDVRASYKGFAHPAGDLDLSISPRQTHSWCVLDRMRALERVVETTDGLPCSLAFASSQAGALAPCVAGRQQGLARSVHDRDVS